MEFVNISGTVHVKTSDITTPVVERLFQEITVLEVSSGYVSCNRSPAGPETEIFVSISATVGDASSLRATLKELGTLITQSSTITIIEDEMSDPWSFKAFLGWSQS